MEQFLLRGSKKAGGPSGSVQINPISHGTADKEMKDESKPKFTPWIEK